MKYFLLITIVTALIIIGAINAMAIEEAKYKVIKKDKHFEIRDYATHIIAETVVEGKLKDAGNIAFKKLFRYISGDNRSRDKVSMTAPVSQQPKGEKIKMTAPVAQQRDKESWVVSFMMPSSYTIENLPEPEDIEVTLRQVPARRMAAVRYSGFWSEEGYLLHKAELESWIHRMGFTVVGVPIWARYNPPFMPWFLRRNEILIPIDVGTD
ncbi:MAG: heme-binding protein [Desulfobacterales bacterium]|nr:heme-binding protein [Desulfobacterales bacterium]